MRTFEYKIKDEVGIHVRPAGMLVQLAKELDSIVTIEKDDKCADATKLFGIMGLGVKKDDVIKITIEDGDEEKSEKLLREFFENM